ncbi:MAG: L,D-transpeptidase family protein [Coriobacteriia bacterium]
MKARHISHAFVALATVVALAFGAVPALATTSATDRGPVPNDAIVGGVHLLGMTEADARSAIASAVVMPVLPPLSVRANGVAFTFDAATAVSVDVEAMLADAYASRETSEAFDLSPRYTVSATRVNAWLATVAARVDRTARNAARVLRGSRFLFTRSAEGRRTDRRTGAASITRALRASTATGGVQPTVVVPVARVRPRVTEAGLGRAILVDLSERRIRLYRGTAVERTYRCAIGMPRYPTPTGSFRVVAKRANPSWGNPGSGWASNMPRYIAPGPRNPLGTRAIYLSISGIRIHGTSKVSSIGHAASHGCMRMLRHDVEELFPLVSIGTPVVIVH